MVGLPEAKWNKQEDDKSYLHSSSSNVHQWHHNSKQSTISDNDRERKVLELYDDGKSTRDIAKELRMSLRDISIILRKNQVSHGIVITKDSENDNNNKSPIV
jgi:DNA-binding NarL/FixJ family response regulator